MRFGLLILSSSQSPGEDSGRIDQLLEQACFAEDAGFGDVWLTEHYFTGESVYNDPLLFATALAMRTSRVRIGFAVLQITLHHPVRLAVQLALLDNLSKGRVDVGVGRGSVYNEYEFVGYGLRSHDSRARMDEAIEVLTGPGPPLPSTTMESTSRFSCRRFARVLTSNRTRRCGAVSSLPDRSPNAVGSVFQF